MFQIHESVLLIVLATGLAGSGVHELIEASEDSRLKFRVWGQQAYSINPQINPDGSYSLFHETGVIGLILKALMGYDGNLEWLRIVVYVRYWLIIGISTIKTWHSPQIKASKSIGQVQELMPRKQLVSNTTMKYQASWN